MLVVDASVAVKWGLAETDSDTARAWIGREPLVAPDFLLLECANVFAQAFRRGRLAQDNAAVALQTVMGAGVRLVPSIVHTVEAQRLAVQLRHTAYDCLYLATALSERCGLLTADGRFADLVEPAYPSVIRRL